MLGDVADPDVGPRARPTGQDAVLHLAAKVDVVGPWADYQRVNVDGHQVGDRGLPGGRSRPG